MKKRLALIPAIIMLAGCSASPAPATTVTVTAPVSSSSAPAPAENVCEYPMSDGLQGIIISSWDLVKASRGESDHARMVDGLMQSVKTAQKDEEKGCKGSVESAELLFEASVLYAAALIHDEGEDDSYKAIMDAGNAWFTAVGFTKYTFTMGENDLGA